jgi:twitching motility protein PilJ
MSQVRERSGQAPINATQSPVSVNTGGIFGNINVPIKLALIITALAIPIAILLFLFLSAQQTQIDAALKEQRGATYLAAFTDIQKLIPEHRGLTNRVLNGDATAGQTRIAKKAAVDAAFVKLNSGELETIAAEFGLEDAEKKLQTDWEKLSANVLNLKADDSFAQHTALMEEQVLPLIRNLANTSNLILDPEQAAYHAAFLITDVLPGFTEALGQLRGLGSGVLARKTVTLNERIALASLISDVNGSDEEMISSLEYIGAADKASLGLRELDKKAAEFSDPFLERVGKEVIQNGQLKFSTAEYFDGVTKVISLHYDIYNGALTYLQKALSDRIASLRNIQTISIIATVLGLLAVSLISFFIARALTNPINVMVGVVNKVGKGDLSELVPLQSSDEIGTLANSFNNSIMELRGLVQTRQDRDNERVRRENLQQNVGDFLDIAMDISMGDFTKRGKVSEDVLGNVVDAINLMVEELGQTIGEVRDAATQVNASANEVLGTTDQIQQGASVTAQATQKVAQQVLAVTNSVRQTAQNAQSAANAAAKTLEAAQQGQQAVTNTLDGMQGIRREVQDISKRIKSLGDRSLEISEIVDTISRIAQQTNLLALNAGIEAAGAGVAGGRFAVVADEVRKLAANAATATGRIETLVKTVQSEIQEVVISVEQGTRQVESGYRIATVAGERLTEISNIAQQSAQLAQAISAAAPQVVQGVDQVNQTVQTISSVAGLTQQNGQKGRESAEALGKLASNLTESLSRFKLEGV